MNRVARAWERQVHYWGYGRAQDSEGPMVPPAPWTQDTEIRDLLSQHCLLHSLWDIEGTSTVRPPWESLQAGSLPPGAKPGSLWAISIGPVDQKTVVNFGSSRNIKMLSLPGCWSSFVGVLGAGGNMQQHLFHLFLFKLRSFIFENSFRCTKWADGTENSHIPPAPSPTSPHRQHLASVRYVCYSEGPIPMHYCELGSTVHVRVRSWRCVFCESGDMHKVMQGL